MSDFLANGFPGFCEALEKASVPLVFCERFDETSNIWNTTRHKHDYIELLYFLYGGAEVSAQERSMEASFYDVMIYPHNTYHTEHLQGGRRREVICLWIDLPELILPNVIHIQDKSAELKWLLEHIHREYKSEAPCKSLIDHYVKSAMILIARKRMQEQAQQDPISRVILYMRDHLHGEITVEEMAQMIYVSKSYLSRVFRQRTGMPLMEYLRDLRLNTAKAMLISTNESIESISYHTGFNSPKYFCKTFRKHAGLPPREFRRRECKGEK